MTGGSADSQAPRSSSSSAARIAWPIDESLFQRLYTKDRAPFWADIERSDGTYRVYFSNDRFFISIDATDPKFDETRTMELLKSLEPLGIERYED